MTDVPTRARLVALAAAGVMFAAYPAIRPYADETSMAGAVAIASPAWIASHTFAMAGFILLAWSASLLPRLDPVGRSARTAPTLAWFGAALVLPYYGAEAFGLHAIAERAVATNDPSLLRLLDTVRYQPVAITMFGLGLVLLAVAGVVAAVALWRAAPALRWGAVVLATGLVLFLPQFFAPAPVRVAHGALLALGCLGLAAFSRHHSETRRPRRSAVRRPAS